MKNLISLRDISKQELFTLFDKADYYHTHPYDKRFLNKCFILFFSETSIRTRVTFEKGISNLGGKSILFPSDTLGKKEDLRDVIGYLNNWADCLVIRYNDINVINKIASYSKCPVINALSDRNHPCEVISDLYSLYKKDKNCLEYQYCYVGPSGNIGLAWKEASEAYGIKFIQCCKKEFGMNGVEIEENIDKALKYTDVIITDSLPKDLIPYFKEYQITKELIEHAKKGVILNPCPPFYRGEEVSEDAMASEAFVGYSFKESLLYVQQAIMDFCME